MLLIALCFLFFTLGFIYSNQKIRQVVQSNKIINDDNILLNINHVCTYSQSIEYLDCLNKEKELEYSNTEQKYIYLIDKINNSIREGQLISDAHNGIREALYVNLTSHHKIWRDYVKSSCTLQSSNLWGSPEQNQLINICEIKASIEYQNLLDQYIRLHKKHSYSIYLYYFSCFSCSFFV